MYYQPVRKRALIKQDVLAWAKAEVSEDIIVAVRISPEEIYYAKKDESERVTGGVIRTRIIDGWPWFYESEDGKRQYPRSNV